MSHHRHNPKRDQNEIIIVEALRYAGAGVWRINEKGLPDLLVLFRGTQYLLEVKTEKGKLTKDQIDFHGEALNHGVKVHVVHNVREALIAIGAIDE